MRIGMWISRSVAAGWVAFALSSHAHPEFQIFVQQNSSRNVDCAMCHAHPDGPDGLKPGQIGSLSHEEIAQLQDARAAFDPGHVVDNPLLNAFGNSLVEQLGKRKLLELRQHPEQLPDAIGYTSDIDGDGIPDAEEYLAGTHPVDPQHGDPWRLFVINMRRNAFHIVMLVLATAAGLFGLNNLLRWFELRQRIEDEAEDDVPPVGDSGRA
jgi:hypothetical protein